MLEIHFLIALQALLQLIQRLIKRLIILRVGLQGRAHPVEKVHHNPDFSAASSPPVDLSLGAAIL